MIGWCYFGYHQFINWSDPVPGILSLVSVSEIFEPSKNILLLAGATLAMTLLLAIILNMIVPCAVKLHRGTRRDKQSNIPWDFKAWFLNFILWILVIISEVVVMNYLVIQPIKR
jgi:hypothetical protein